jgi:chromosome segregation protein
MRIDRINLIGFKSFSEKTSFNFHPGLTAIVGPNGCGKSNIVDAFKWVLGEQSAKSLRGDSMEDVIFTGSAIKKPKGMAEVTLMLSGMGNGDSSAEGQVSVTRRLYRSGESEYMMNKIPCRLKDIKNLFLDTGLELKAYSILEQGRIDVILNSKPKERRFLIEEVAGVMKYNIRKTEALQKLETSRSNLQRLQDIVTEVKRQINSIDRYAKRAQRYKRLFDEIRDIEIKIAVRDTAVMGEELDTILSSEKNMKSRETELSTSIHSSDALIAEKKLQCVEQEKAIEEVQNTLHVTEREFVEEEGRISVVKSDCENLEGRLQRLRIREGELTDTGQSLHNQIGEVGQRNKELDTELVTIDEIVNAKNNELSALEHDIADIEQNLELKRRAVFHKTEEISDVKNEINNLTLIKEGLERKERKTVEDMKLIKNNISSVAAVLKEMSDEIHGLDAELKTRSRTKENLLNDLQNRKKELEEREEELYRDREDLAAMSSREESLKELDSAGESAVKDNVKILCQVADIFDARPEHETAIEAVLGDKLKAAVVDDQNEIKRALQFIREHKISRSGFIPVNISSIQQSPSGAVPSAHVIGRALDFVSVKEGFQKVAVSLLNDVMIVENLDTAFDLWHKALSPSGNSQEVTCYVTLDGEVLEPSGIVSGGVERGVLKIKREIRELRKSIEKKQSHIVLAEKNVSNLKNDIAVLERNIASEESERTEKEKSYHELQLKRANMEEEEKEQRKRLDFLSAELKEDKKEKDRTGQGLDEKNKQFGTLENERHSIEEDVRVLQDNLGNKKNMLEGLRDDLTVNMLSRTALKEKKDSLVREHERLHLELGDLEKKKEQMSDEYRGIDTDISQKKEEIKQKQDALTSSVVTIGELKDKFSRLKEVLEARTAELTHMERQQKTYVDELTAARKELAQVEVKKTELSMGIDHIKDNIEKIYSTDIDHVTGEHDQPETLVVEEEEKLPGLRQKLQEIGPVNLGTLEELEELRTRYDFLTKQQDDLLQSIESLQETISKINRTTKKKLSDAFEALNEKFKEVFTVLFGKGRAELILTEDDILEAGIDIVAQPPGKKLQNLMLLSGGEKALTALSLLFAGFMIKPTPLCLLDEVDAPLDESNTDRFTSLLTALAKNIQFIIITHNRRTMEVADYLYGVTMEEPGISKVVSMHLAEETV